MGFTLRLVLLFCMLFRPRVFSEAAFDCYGKEFILAFTENVAPWPILALNVELHVTTMSTSNVTVCAEVPLMPGVTKVCGNTTFGTVMPLILPKTTKLSGSAIESKGILVTATDDVVVYGFNKEILSSDGFLALPTDSAGTEYFSMHGTPSSVSGDYAEFAVVGTENDTAVEIQLSYLPNVNVSFQGNMYLSNASFQVGLDKYETLQLQSEVDMTGSRIVASKPVLFFSGNKKTSLRLPTESSDHLIEQLPPVSNWGKEFLVIAVKHRSAGDLIRIIGGSDGTSITVQQSPSLNFTQHQVVLGRGEFDELDVPSNTTHYITASLPVAVFQFCKTNHADGYGSDPFMMYIPPVDQFMSLYTFATLNAVGGASFQNTVNLFISSSAAAGLRLDGQPLNPSNYTTLLAPNATTGIQLSVSPGTHQLSHVNNVTFGAFMYGQTSRDTYGFPAGMKVVPINVESESLEVPKEGLPLELIIVTTAGGAVIIAAVITAIALKCCCCAGCLAGRRRKKNEKEEDRKPRKTTVRKIRVNPAGGRNAV